MKFLSERNILLGWNIKEMRASAASKKIFALSERKNTKLSNENKVDPPYLRWSDFFSILLGYNIRMFGNFGCGTRLLLGCLLGCFEILGVVLR